MPRAGAETPWVPVTINGRVYAPDIFLPTEGWITQGQHNEYLRNKQMPRLARRIINQIPDYAAWSTIGEELLTARNLETGKLEQIFLGGRPVYIRVQTVRDVVKFKDVNRYTYYWAGRRFSSNVDFRQRFRLYGDESQRLRAFESLLRNRFNTQTPLVLLPQGSSAAIRLRNIYANLADPRLVIADIEPYVASTSEYNLGLSITLHEEVYLAEEVFPDNVLPVESTPPSELARIRFREGIQAQRVARARLPEYARIINDLTEEYRSLLLTDKRVILLRKSFQNLLRASEVEVAKEIWRGMSTEARALVGLRQFQALENLIIQPTEITLTEAINLFIEVNTSIDAHRIIVIQSSENVYRSYRIINNRSLEFYVESNVRPQYPVATYIDARIAQCPPRGGPRRLGQISFRVLGRFIHTGLAALVIYDIYKLAKGAFEKAIETPTDTDIRWARTFGIPVGTFLKLKKSPLFWAYLNPTPENFARRENFNGMYRVLNIFVDIIQGGNSDENMRPINNLGFTSVDWRAIRTYLVTGNPGDTAQIYIPFIGMVDPRQRDNSNTFIPTLGTNRFDSVMTSTVADREAYEAELNDQRQRRTLLVAWVEAKIAELDAIENPDEQTSIKLQEYLFLILSDPWTVLRKFLNNTDNITVFVRERPELANEIYEMFGYDGEFQYIFARIINDPQLIIKIRSVDPLAPPGNANDFINRLTTNSVSALWWLTVNNETATAFRGSQLPGMSINFDITTSVDDFRRISNPNIANYAARYSRIAQNLNAKSLCEIIIPPQITSLSRKQAPDLATLINNHEKNSKLQGEMLDSYNDARPTIVPIKGTDGKITFLSRDAVRAVMSNPRQSCIPMEMRPSIPVSLRDILIDINEPDPDNYEYPTNYSDCQGTRLDMDRLIVLARLRPDDDWGNQTGSQYTYSQFVEGWRGINDPPTEQEMIDDWATNGYGSTVTNNLNTQVNLLPN